MSSLSNYDTLFHSLTARQRALCYFKFTYGMCLVLKYHTSSEMFKKWIQHNSARTESVVFRSLLNSWMPLSSTKNIRAQSDRKMCGWKRESKPLQIRHVHRTVKYEEGNIKLWSCINERTIQIHFGGWSHEFIEFVWNSIIFEENCLSARQWSEIDSYIGTKVAIRLAI